MTQIASLLVKATVFTRHYAGTSAKNAGGAYARRGGGLIAGFYSNTRDLHI